ncbi:MAG: DUF3471 domain-containing protein, partial [Acidobacteria bacterium]|nr:DUF3471 domain-containing protein [Acidobacteriota bacterium]
SSDLVPLFREAGVRLVLSGHEHNFQHAVVDGIDYVISGAAGKLRPEPPTGFDVAGTRSWASAGHFLLVDVDDRILARYVGRYELAPGLEFEVTLAAGRLGVKLGDQPRFPVYPESESKFFFEVVDAQITFVQNAAGETVSLVLHQAGRDQEAKRIE